LTPRAASGQGRNPPGLAQQPAFFEKIAAPVSGLDLVADGVRQRQFNRLGREIGLFGRPVL
jgi:hypothetical protein